jgi:DNA-binding PadR family transcriptional regulator
MFSDFHCSPRGGGGWNFDQSGFGGWWGGGGQGGGRRRGRVFEQGDLKLVILQLLTEKPRHGYEIIKALEERTGGAYSPSPGVIYPTLTLLEDLGYARAAASEGGRRVYEITQAGREHLDENRATVDEIFQRMSDQWTPGPDNPMMALGSAFGGLTRAAFAAVTRTGTNEARIRKIRDIIEEATRSIDNLDR